MNCPNCQFENREGAKFCGKCGHKFEITCPECGTKNQAENDFCDECGSKLSLPLEQVPKQISFDEKLTKIQKYLPKGLTEKILSQKDKIEGERKQVTVMFCDMEGFTSLSEKLGLEDAYDIMDEVYELLIHKVHDYEGTVNEMTGDGIVALFGAPIALEDAPQRSIRSAMAIHREMSNLSDRMNKERKGMSPLKMRIGIHTGPVVVGTLGNDLRVEFKAVGDTVNLASRVESLAVPGATYVTEETFKLTEGLFRFETIGQKQVKGKKEPVNVYRVIAPSTRRTRFDVSAERGLTPFVGRKRELDLLLEGFERSKGGRGQAFSIVSEAGAGKSRLLYEFRKAVISADVMFLEGRCLSYSRGIAYHPIIDILKANFDIRETDGDSQIREKVKKGLRILGLDEASTFPYLLELLSVKDSGIDKIPISPEARKDRIIETINRIALKGSELRPLIMAFEDLHWSDKSSEESLKYLLDCITGARIFLIFTYRPEFVYSWGGRSYHSQVTLNRLSNHESLAMVTHLLDTEEIERDLEELILEKTEGIPFFIEEFTRSLKDLKVINKTDNKYCLAKEIQDVTIPSTVQDVVMARVDSLPEGSKEVLQTGSVIERDFSYELIKRVSGLAERELLSHLSVLKDSELLYETGIYPQSAYIFKHTLTREVVYNSILTKRKKRLHEKIAHAIEEFYKNNLYEHCEVLAKHLIESEDYEKGAKYSKLAAKKAQKAASFKDAIEHAQKSLFCLKKLPETDSTLRRIVDTMTDIANYFMILNQCAEAKKAVDPIVNLAFELNYQKKLPSIYNVLGQYMLWVEEDYSKFYQYLNKALKIAEKEADFISLSFTCLFLGGNLSANCEFERGLHYLKRSLDLQEAANSLSGIASVKSNIATFNYILRGSIDLAYQISEESVHIAEESGDILAKGIAYSSHGSACYYKGLFDKAEGYLLEGLAFCEKILEILFGSWASFFLGKTYSELGEYQKGKYYYRNAISILEDASILPSLVNLFSLALTRLSVLGKDEDIESSELLKFSEKNKVKACEGWIARYIGEILLYINDQHIAEAENWIKKAIETDKRNGMMFNLAKDYASYAELFIKKGNQSKANENLKKAIEISRECGADGWVERYEKALSAL